MAAVSRVSDRCHAWASLACAAAWLLSGCAADGHGGPEFDAGIGGGRDASAARRDASGSFSDAGRAFADAGAPLGEAFASGPLGAVNVCLDGNDNDRNGVADCADSTCLGAVDTCCVGSAARACCPLRDPMASVDPTRCAAGDPVATCTGTSLQPFGGAVLRAPDAMIDRAVLVPGADPRTDSGFVTTSPLALATHRVLVRATLALPAACASGCTQFLAFGFVADVPVGSVRPMIGVLLSARLGEVRVIRGDEVVATSPMFAGSGVYELEVSPDGDVEVRFAGTSLASFRIERPGDARLVFYGRNANLSAGELPARFEQLTVSSGACDLPASLRARRQVLPQLDASKRPTWPDAPDVLSEPSLASYSEGGESHRVLVFGMPAGIGVAAEARDGSFVPDSDVPALANASGTIDGAAVLRFSSPELVYDGPASWRLYATATLDGGRTRLVVANSTQVFPSTFVGPVAIRVPDSLSAYDLAQPAVARLGGQWLLVARASRPRSSEPARLVRLESVDGEIFTFAPGGTLETETLAQASAGTRFDADDVSSPALVSTAYGWHLYYTGRRGTRRAIGMLASPDTSLWRALDEEVLAPTGNTSDFDGIAVADPFAIVADGDVRLYYTGSNGARQRIGLALGSVPTTSRSTAP